MAHSRGGCRCRRWRYGGYQPSATYFIFKDNTSGDWWFNYQGVWVGRWPRSYYDTTGIANSASRIDFGGEVYDDVAAYHTFTDMGGDGSYPAAGLGHAAYQLLLQYVTISGGQYFLNKATSLTETRNDADCYDVDYVDSTTGWGAYMFFGGPGNHSGCTN
jgi:hypothetical protein